MEVSSILLESRVKISGITLQGISASSICLERKSRSLLKLPIQLRTNEHFEFLYQTSRENELNEVVKQFGRLKSGE